MVATLLLERLEHHLLDRHLATPRNRRYDRGRVGPNRRYHRPT